MTNKRIEYKCSVCSNECIVSFVHSDTPSCDCLIGGGNLAKWQDTSLEARIDKFLRAVAKQNNVILETVIKIYDKELEQTKHGNISLEEVFTAVKEMVNSDVPQFKPEDMIDNRRSVLFFCTCTLEV